MTYHVDNGFDPYRSPVESGTPGVSVERRKKRLPAAAWNAVIAPPLAMLGAIGLGEYIDSLTLGPRGFFFVIILIGPGAWGIAAACAAAVIAFLSQGSAVTKVSLWIVEIALCMFVYSQVLPLLGGWG